MKPAFLAVAIVALLSAPIARGDPVALADQHPAGLPHDCRGMMSCDGQHPGPFTPPPCAVASVACTAPALIDHPYALAAFDAHQTAAPNLGRSLHAQRAIPVSTPPPRS